MRMLVDPGDVSAEPGSRRWCIGVHGQVLLQKGKTHAAVGSMQFWLRKLRENDNFQQLPDANGVSFDLWEDFVQYPEPHGMGMRVDIANAILAERDPDRVLSDVVESVPVLRKHGRPSNDEEKGSDATFPPIGRGADYLAARLKRDAPEIAARINEFPSIRAAAKAAGIIKDRTPVDVVRQAWQKADTAERQQIAALVASEREQPDPPEDDDDQEQDDKFLELINGHYQVGVMRLLERYNGDDLIGELRRIAVERVIDQHISWIDVLDLMEEHGFGLAVDAFQTVGNERWLRDWEQKKNAPPEPEPKPKARRRRTR